MSLSKSNSKLITSLQQKKYRQKHKLFIAEGVKVVTELLQSNLELHSAFMTSEILDIPVTIPITLVTESELKKISVLKSPNKVLAIFKVPSILFSEPTQFTLVLDGINDPGNLGTIIRLCDWFGVKQLLCSKNTVDCYNPKVVQATMGSITRVSIHYIDIVVFLSQTKLPVFTADMEGENVFKAILPEQAVLVMGNEANGISEEVKAVVQKKLTIPRFGQDNVTESLNVASATSILLSEFKRSLE